MKKLIILTILFNQIVSIVSTLQWSGVVTTSIPNGGDIVTYGSFSTLAQGNGRNVKIYYQEYSGTTPYWSFGATLVANLTNSEGRSQVVDVGSSLSASKGLLALDILFAGAPKNNSVFVFQDTRLHWTQQQVLTSPDSGKNDSFGYDVAIDVLRPNRAVISAPFDDDNGPTSGSAYVFLSTPSGTSWTLTQKLRSDYISPYGRYGEEVAIFDNKIAVTAPGDCKVYLYSEHPTSNGPFWTQQQVLWYSGCGGALTISQYGNDLAVGNPTYTNPTSAPTTTYSGIVYLLDSKTYRGECDGDFMPHDLGEFDHDTLSSFESLLAMKDKPPQPPIYERNLKMCEVTRWSHTQSITATNNLCGYFGSSVAVFENVLVVARLSDTNSCPLTGADQTSLRIYERDPATGTWTLSDTINTPVSYSTSGAGTNGLSLYGTSFVLGTKNNYDRVYSFTPTTTSVECVFLEFADTFGDGWSGVDLLITNTEHYTERYTFSCDAVSNPRTVRYCPMNMYNYNDNSFKMEIMNARAHPYHDEIRWTVTPQGTNIKTYGDMDTKLEFIFDGFEMILFKGEDVVAQVNDCLTECKANFAPSSENMVVLPITLYDSGGNSWHNTYKYGTSYVITDRKGEHVYAEGTLCASTTSQTCYVELPYDEKFAIRVAGALDSNVGQHTWSFCGFTGSGVDHVSFITSSKSTQACWVEEDYTQGTYCQNILHSVPLQGVVILHGFHTHHNLSHWDELALSSALENVFHSKSPLYTSYSYSMDSSQQGMKVQFITYIPIELFGLDGLDPDNLQVAYSYAENLLTTGVSSGLFVNSIDNYLATHQKDGHHYDLYDHGYVQLLSVHQERYWKNYIPLSFSPTSIPTHQSTTSSPAANTSPSTLTGESSSSNHHKNNNNDNDNETSSTFPVPLIIFLFVVCGGMLIFYLNRSSSSSSSSSSGKNKKKSKNNSENIKNQKKTYRELSTSSQHKVDPLYDDEDDDDEEEGEEGSDSDSDDEEEGGGGRDIEASCFTECVEDHPEEEFHEKEKKKKLIQKEKKKKYSKTQTSPSSTSSSSPYPSSLSPSSSSSSSSSSSPSTLKTKNPIINKQTQELIVKKTRKSK